MPSRRRTTGDQAPRVHPADVAAAYVLEQREWRAWRSNPPYPEDRLPTLWAMDPGGEHVGMAEFQRDDERWHCIKAWETTPDHAVDLVANRLLFGLIDHFVGETWRLFPDKAASLSYSDMPTSQMIGAVKYVIKVSNRSFARHAKECPFHAGTCDRRHNDGLADYCAIRQIDVLEEWQHPDIKQPTYALLRSRGIKSTAVRDQAGGHAKDAECHGWHYLGTHLGTWDHVPGGKFPQRK